MKSLLVIFALLLATITLSSCADSLGGDLRPDGSISSCGGHHTDSEACGRATFNARVIGQIHAGQPFAEVRSIMKHDAERRTIDNNSESWGYISDYQAEMMTWITFTDGKVSAMTTGPWKESK
jgi:hypothetical protein